MNDQEKEKWANQGNESEKAYRLFKCYLETRDYTTVSEMQHLSVQYIRRLASKYDWQSRASAYDQSKLQEARQKLSKRYADFLRKQWEGNEIILEKVQAAMKSKDFTGASLRVLSDCYSAFCNAQQQLSNLLQLGNSGGDDPSQLRIQIVSKASGDC